MKIIDLLNKIANGKTPPKIKFKNTIKPIFEYNMRNGKYEYCYKSNKGKNEICELTFLNLKDEIELIEEDKAIELPEKINELVYQNDEYGYRINSIIANQNQIIDYLKAKEEREDKE